MSEQKHTPGPWRKGGVSGGAVWFGEKMVAAVYGDDPDCKADERMQANARLIAAAPDLLSALERAKDVLSGVQEDRFDLDMDEINIAINIVDAAIAKATGAAA
jgi:hypothetical protein